MRRAARRRCRAGRAASFTLALAVAFTVGAIVAGADVTVHASPPPVAVTAIGGLPVLPRSLVLRPDAPGSRQLFAPPPAVAGSPAWVRRLYRIDHVPIGRLELKNDRFSVRLDGSMRFSTEIPAFESRLHIDADGKVLDLQLPSVQVVTRTQGYYSSVEVVFNIFEGRF